MHGAAERARKASAGARPLHARGVAGVGATPRPALFGIDFDAPVDEDEARQKRLVAALAAADAAPLRRGRGCAVGRYDACSTGSSRASSAGTSTGLETEPAPASAAVAGMTSPAWLASA